MLKEKLIFYKIYKGVLLLLDYITLKPQNDDYYVLETELCQKSL